MLTDKKFYAIMFLAVLLPGVGILYRGGNVWQSVSVIGGLLVFSFIIIGAYMFYILFAPDKTARDLMKALLWQ